MVKTFTCYLHRPGAMTPELRIIACDAASDLQAALVAELKTWPKFDILEVYDEDDLRICRLGADASPAT